MNRHRHAGVRPYGAIGNNVPSALSILKAGATLQAGLGRHLRLRAANASLLLTPYLRERLIVWMHFERSGSWWWRNHGSYSAARAIKARGFGRPVL